jgi:uncharacterized protein (TIGR02646 family)
MVKINLPKDIESWYLKEIEQFFKRSKTLSYKKSAKIVKDSLGISFKKLLVASPEDLESIARDIQYSKPTNFSSDKVLFIKIYEKFRTSVSSKNYIEKVNLKVCPYCNRNYIFNFKKKKTKSATAQLDHFIDKSTYPYLALSMYNLVPSCATCNHRKSAKDVLAKPIFNPYLDNIHNHINFSSSEILSIEDFDSKSLDFFSEDRLKVNIKATTTDEKIKEHLDTFNIEELYNNHKDTITELYQKKVIYTDSYIDELMDKYEETVFKNSEELLQLITCGYMDDESINKRPLSKLIKDISKELGLT